MEPYYEYVRALLRPHLKAKDVLRTEAHASSGAHDVGIKTRHLKVPLAFYFMQTKENTSARSRLR